MKALDIVGLLKIKHKDDIFIPECKVGGSYDKGSPRLDVWTMNKSWANNLITGYEVKVSRSDFINDNKWHSYLPYVNCFYFVCPDGLITLEDLPPSIGLIWVSRTGNRLIVKRKALYDAKIIPNDIFKYILMWRVSTSINVNRLDDYALWLQNKNQSIFTGKTVSKTLRKLYDDNVERVELENEKLRKENQNLTDIKNILKDMGYNGTPSKYEVENKIRLQKEIFPRHVRGSIYNAITYLQKVYDEIKKMEEE